MVPLVHDCTGVHDFTCGHDPICSAAYGFPRPDQDRTRDVANRGLHSLIISLAQRVSSSRHSTVASPIVLL